MTLQDIEKFAKKHSDARSELADVLNEMQSRVDQLTDLYIKQIRIKAATSKRTKSKLADAVEAGKGLFVKPRTKVFHNIKVGFAKGKGKMVCADEGKTKALIKKGYQDDIGALITTTSTLNMKGLSALSATDLKALGISIINSSDQLVVKSTEKDLDKLVSALLVSDEEVS